jgi:hypothetical protein
MKTTRTFWWTVGGAVFFSSSLALSGCGSSDSGASSSAAGAAGAANSAGAAGTGQGDSSQLVGSFQVKATPATSVVEASTAVVGKVYDGATPSTVVWENPQVDGACTLSTPRVPFCTTPCGSSGACVEDDTCQAYPIARGVGSVTVTGVKTTGGDSSFTMTPIANTYQPPGSVSLAYPPFAEGDTVTFSAAGDYFPAFTLTSKGVAPLALTSTSLGLNMGKALNVTWLPGSAGTANIHVKLDISHHGGTKGQIECDSDDTGSLTVTAPLITKLLGLGVAGYPTVIVTRQALGSSVISAGRVELDVYSIVEQAITVEGLTSCDADEDCPSGQTCQTDQSCK